MSFLFLRLNARGEVTGQCRAESLTLARAALPCGGGSYVTSAASFALGRPKTLATPRLCQACDRPISDKSPTPVHPRCAARLERAREKYRAKAETKAKRAAYQKARAERLATGAATERRRQGTIAAGIARRKRRSA